jgi:hypothetical protein
VTTQTISEKILSAHCGQSGAVRKVIPDCICVLMSRCLESLNASITVRLLACGEQAFEESEGVLILDGASGAHGVSTVNLRRTYLSQTADQSLYVGRAGEVASGISCRSVPPSLMKILVGPSNEPFA